MVDQWYLALEHRDIPARVRSVANELRVNSKVSLVWALACQESVPGGHAGVGVISLRDGPLTLHASSSLKRISRVLQAREGLLG